MEPAAAGAVVVAWIVLFAGVAYVSLVRRDA
jgi:hypothetical protein